MVNGDREHLEPSEDNSNNYTRERLTLQSYIETKKILLPIIILWTKNSWNLFVSRKLERPRLVRAPHAAQTTTTAPSEKSNDNNRILHNPQVYYSFFPSCRKKKLVKLNFANFFCNSCRAAKVPRPTTLLGARFVIKVSFITMIINIFMLIHHYTTKIY